MAYEVKKDPDADLDYGFDWTAWLGATDTITESTWLVPSASGLTAHSPSISTDGKVTSVWLKSGNASRRGVFRDEPYQNGRGTRGRAIAAGDDCGSIGDQADRRGNACDGSDPLSFPDRDCIAWIHFPESRFHGQLKQ